MPTTARRRFASTLTKSDLSGRLTRLRRALRLHRASWLLVTNPLDVGYLTGFLGGDSFLLVGPSGLTIISDSRYEEELAHLPVRARIVMRSGSIAAAVGSELKSRRVRRVAIQSESVTLMDRAMLEKAASGVSFVPLPGLVQPLREVKDAGEVANIRAAAKIQEAALLATLKTIRVGQTELEVAARLEYEMKTRGSSVPAFETIVAARANGSLPHYRPQRTTLANGQGLLIDWGATVGGYRSDMTRTFAIRKWPSRLREIYTIVLDAHHAAVSVLRAGARTTDVDAAARGIISKAGYGKHFGHGLGHGIGLNIHEGPRLAHQPPGTELRAGMVVTIEPGIYLPGVGGVRLENDYLVTQRGAQCLCSLPLDLDWATL
ncbi:MAG: aminopeptidase P family protein [Leptolyngbya sp. PLA1]|nr:aminopeptidase P family protein [Leptolyngbya sp. PLA1]